MHACNAVDGTAAKLHPSLGSNARFTKLLRDNYSILEPMAAPGINLDDTRFPVKVERPKAPGGLPDFADVVYGIHRCHQGHGEALPGGFELIRNANGQPGYTSMEIRKEAPRMGRVRLSDRTIFGLLAVAVLSPVNVDQKVPDGYHFTFGRRPLRLEINDWWGGWTLDAGSAYVGQLQASAETVVISWEYNLVGVGLWVTADGAEVAAVEARTACTSRRLARRRGPRRARRSSSISRRSPTRTRSTAWRPIPTAATAWPTRASRRAGRSNPV
jgi:hypothetical protein